MQHIFLSYSRKDHSIMKRVKDDLITSELTVWTDENIQPGTPSWQRAIEEAIINSSCLISILSPDAKESDWVREELNFAKTHSKRIFLILARGDERSSIPFGYSGYQRVDISKRGQYPKEIKKLIEAIKNMVDVVSTVSTNDVVIGGPPFVESKIISQRKLQYVQGMRIRHAKFGEGIVIESNPSGDDEEVTISFKAFGIKRLAASFGNLNILGSDIPEQNTKPQFKTGMRVRHNKFGEGVVVDSSLRGNDEEVTISFKAFGIKRLAASFANLTIISSPS